eukprot:SM002410S08228  [mRNA]  locus=s2410:104:1780:+ [translate_table: standard]
MPLHNDDIGGGGGCGGGGAEVAFLLANGLADVGDKPLTKWQKAQARKRLREAAERESAARLASANGIVIAPGGSTVLDVYGLKPRPVNIARHLVDISVEDLLAGRLRLPPVPLRPAAAPSAATAKRNRDVEEALAWQVKEVMALLPKRGALSRGPLWGHSHHQPGTPSAVAVTLAQRSRSPPPAAAPGTPSVEEGGSSEYVTSQPAADRQDDEDDNPGSGDGAAAAARDDHDVALAAGARSPGASSSVVVAPTAALTATEAAMDHPPPAAVPLADACAGPQSPEGQPLVPPPASPAHVAVSFLVDALPLVPAPEFFAALAWTPADSTDALIARLEADRRADAAER